MINDLTASAVIIDLCNEKILYAETPRRVALAIHGQHHGRSERGDPLTVFFYLNYYLIQSHSMRVPRLAPFRIKPHVKGMKIVTGARVFFCFNGSFRVMGKLRTPTLGRHKHQTDLVLRGPCVIAYPKVEK